ncbi:hypothetical protein GCM10025876_22190 [Demequina litorisediminis]|uniref:Uncharacterized protein n=1 Tax=Demequina litorisediminis TaxID=1849022 RepID=A0ABQ6IFF0_9MICO|nr:hypothetical protein GCM10025876_22190 [Demequina litorisediminis]
MATNAPPACAANARGSWAWCCPSLQNPIFPALAEIIGGTLAQNGYTPLLCTQNAGGITESDYVDLLLAQQVSGVIFLGGHYTEADAPHGHYERLRRVKPAHRPGERAGRFRGLRDRLHRRRIGR